MKKILKIILAILISINLVLTFPIQTNALKQFGQEADLVVGQDDFIGNQAYRGGVGTFNDLRSLTIINGKFVAGSWDGSKVYIWNTLPTSGLVAPDLILGDTAENTSDWGTINANTITNVNGIAFDGTKLYVADWVNNRILIWNTFPTVNNQPADAVLGQPNLTSGYWYCDSPSATSLCRPSDILISGGKFIVTDFGNHRVLIWDSIPASNLVPADHVIGQPNFTSNTANNGGVSNKSIKAPHKLLVHNGKLLISEFENHRVLIFNSIPNTDFATADYVIGQPDFTSNDANHGGISGATLNYPYEMKTDSNGRLYLSDDRNNRVLIYNSIPTSNGATADLVLGQPDFITNTSYTGGITAKSFGNGAAIMIHNSKLYLSTGPRILVYDTLPTQNYQAADHIIGQSNFTEILGKKRGFEYPTGSLVIGNKLVVAEQNSRVLIYDGFPNVNLKEATYVIGQPDLNSTTENNGGITNKSLNDFIYIATDGTRLVVSDYYNSRVLIYNQLPTSNFAEADLVIGQPGFGTNGCNQGGISASTLCYPTHVSLDDGKLLVTDYYNHRVLIWNTIPTSNGQAANVVVGQPNMTSNSQNNGGISAKSLKYPYAAMISNNKLIVTDGSNNRVLIFNTVPETDFKEADVVIGQELLTTNDSNHNGLSDKSLSWPTESFVDEYAHLWIADGNNQRVMMYDSIPTSNFTAANVVIGQPDFTSLENDWDGLALSNRFEWLESVSYWNNKLLVSDNGNNRVLIFKLGPKITSVDVSDTLTNGSVTVTTVSSEATYMKVSTDPSFTGASWIPYQASYTFSDFSNDNTLKHLYVKYKATNYEYESDVYSFEISSEGTPPNKVVIKSIGLIPNVPNKDSLSYYFTSQTPTIKGTSDVGTTVYFKTSDHTYTTTTGLDGKYSINLSNPSLSRGVVNLTYYAVDIDGRKSAERTLKLTIGEENFPNRSSSSESSETSSSSSSSSLTSSSSSSSANSTSSSSSSSSTSNKEVVETKKEITIKDENGNLLINTKVTINGKTYTTDSKGEVKAEVSGVYVVEYEKNGVKYSANIKSSDSVANLKSSSTQNTNILIYIIVIVGILISVLFIFKKRKKENVSKI